jgi:thiamine biosynthesis lipoprotein
VAAGLACACVAAIVLTSPGLGAQRQAAVGADRADGVRAETGRDGSTWLEREAFLMGTALRVRARAETREVAAVAIEAAFDSVDAMERRLSSWRDDTALGRLRAEGRAAAEPATLELLETARRWSRRTDGAFDPTLGALVDAWDLRGEGRRPTGQDLASARAASGWACFDVEAGDGDAARDGDTAGEIAARCPGAWIDAGAFGKGAALERAMKTLRARGATSGLLDFGGQITVFGTPPDDRGAWPVWVAHPDRRDEPAVRLALDDGSVATTAASERFVVLRDTVRGHVLAPGTGEPVEAWGSVTVHARDPLAADALATALFVMGPEEGLAWAEARTGVAALFLRPGPDGLEVACDAEMRAMIEGARETTSKPETWKGC